MKRVWLSIALTCLPAAAWAGGFEYPDNGTEALGRGGAFTAKADSPLALQYNIAGLARQRGTRVLFDSNLSFKTSEFTRAGVYPGDPSDLMTLYAGQRFPTIGNKNGPFYAPFVGIATDFGILDRWTFAIGGFGPSAYGKLVFPGGNDLNAAPETVRLPNGMPAPPPQRYDLTYADLLIILPTVAAAVRVTKWLDLGLAIHFVYGKFDLANFAFTDLGPRCPNTEYAPCDAMNHLEMNGFTAAASLGVMARPIRALSIGMNLRTPIYLNATGEVKSPGPQLLPLALEGTVNSFKTTLPWVLRLGVRYIFMGNDGFEHGDIELDGVYEAWHDAQGDGIPLDVDVTIAQFKTLLAHHFKDTGSVRLGGAYNVRLPAGILTLRTGVYFDSEATDPWDTRLDFDTMHKVGTTLGLGYSIRGVSINLAYAYIWSPDRNVTDGRFRSLNGLNGTDRIDSGEQLPVVNNGFYHVSTQILSFGFQVAFDELLKKRRVIRYD